MSFNVNTISAGSTAVISRQAVAEQQFQVSQVKAGKVQADGNRVEDSRAVTSTFGTSADRIEISPEGRKALEQIYAARIAKASQPAQAAAAKPQTSETAKTAASTELAAAQNQAVSPIAARTEEAAKAEIEPVVPVSPAAVAEEANPAQDAQKAERAEAEMPAAPAPGSGAATEEEDGVSSTELQNMSVSELRTLVTEGTITRAQMDSEISRRESENEQSEQKAQEATEAMNEAMNSMKELNSVSEKLNTFNTTKQYAAVAQALS